MPEVTEEYGPDRTILTLSLVKAINNRVTNRVTDKATDAEKMSLDLIAAFMSYINY